MDINEQTETRIYELAYHLVPGLAVEQIPATSEAIRGIIEKVSTAIIAQGEPIFIDLAYSIVKTIEHKNKSFDKAYFGWIKFEGSPAGIAPLEERLKKDENILRYFILKTTRENIIIAKDSSQSDVKQSGDGRTVRPTVAIKKEPTVSKQVHPERVASEIITVVPEPVKVVPPVATTPVSKATHLNEDELDKALEELIG